MTAFVAWANFSIAYLTVYINHASFCKCYCTSMGAILLQNLGGQLGVKPI